MGSKAKKQAIELDGHTIELSNQDRVVFPDSGITKGDVVSYYKDIASVMVPELRGRALSVERFTKGIDAGGFFQKHWQKHYPDWLDSITFGGKTVVKYPICDSQAGLVYFANQGAVAMHMPERWGYVQFSERSRMVQPFRAARFLDNPDEPVKWGLRRLYYRQADYRTAHGRYARSLTELGASD